MITLHFSYAMRVATWGLSFIGEIQICRMYPIVWCMVYDGLESYDGFTQALRTPLVNHFFDGLGNGGWKKSCTTKYETRTNSSDFAHLSTASLVNHPQYGGSLILRPNSREQPT